MSRSRVYISGYHHIVSCFALDAGTGVLKLLSSSDAGPSPTYLAQHPSGAFLYAANEVAPGRISAYAINPQDGRLVRINEASSAGDGPCHVSVHLSGKWVFAANYGNGTIGVLPVRPDGGVGEPLAQIVPGKNAHQILCDPAGRHVFVPCLGSDWVAQYHFDAATGALTPSTPATLPVAAKAGPRHLAFHPSGCSACLINELDNTMISLAYDPAQGVLTPRTVVSTLPAGCTVESSAGHLLFDPSGCFVYGSNRGHDSVVVFAFDAASGALCLVGHKQGSEIACPRDFTIDPTGRCLLVAGQDASRVTVFRCDPATGALRRLTVTKVPPAPAFVGVV